MIVYDGTNFRAVRFEGGNGAGINKYAVWPFLDLPVDGYRKTIKQIKVTGDANSLYVYALPPGFTVMDVTNTALATAGPYTLLSGESHEPVIWCNLQNAQSYTIRIDSTISVAEIEEVSVYGNINRIMR